MPIPIPILIRISFDAIYPIHDWPSQLNDLRKFIAQREAVFDNDWILGIIFGYSICNKIKGLKIRSKMWKKATDFWFCLSLCLSFFPSLCHLLLPLFSLTFFPSCCFRLLAVFFPFLLLLQWLPFQYLSPSAFSLTPCKFARPATPLPLPLPRAASSPSVTHPHLQQLPLLELFLNKP